jgi:PAS domain S-box-containing protein
MKQAIQPLWARMPLWLAVTLLFAVPWAFMVASAPARTKLNGILEVGFPVVVLGLAVVTLVRASRREQLPVAFRSSLRWMAAGFASCTLAALYVLIHDVILRRMNTGAGLGLADLLCMATYPLVIVGQLRLPRSSQAIPRLPRVLLDSATFIFGVGVPLWVFAVKPSLGQVGGMDALVTVSFPFLAFAGVVATNFVLLRCVPLPSRSAFNLVLAGITLSWMADLVFTLVVTQQMRIPNLFHLANLINVLSFLLILVGAWRILADPVPDRAPQPPSFSPIPMFSIVVLAVWAGRFLQIFGSASPNLLPAIMGVSLVFLLILLREGLAVLDSTRIATQTVTQALRIRYEALVPNPSDLILVLDGKGQLTYSSQGAATLFESAEGGLEGRKLSDFIHPDDASAWDDFLAGLWPNPGAKRTGQWRMRNLQSGWRVFETSGNNLLLDPNVQGLLLNARDVTERVRLEDERRQFEIMALRNEKMESLGILAGGVAHDMNNVLGAILGLASVHELTSAQGSKFAKDMGTIARACHRGGSLVKSLLNFAREGNPVECEVDLNAIVREKVSLLERTTLQKVRLEMDLAETLLPMRGDPAALGHVLVNLCVNSVDAMPQGGTLTLRTRNDCNDMLLLEVADTGHGMPKEVQDRALDPFFTTKPQGKGTGLGLPIVYGTVKALLGNMEILSEPGQGTRVLIRFPASGPSRMDPRTTVGPTPLAARKSLEVLLVDDDDLILSSIRAVLESLGHTATVASGGQQALALLEAGLEPDVIILDMNMPGLDGAAILPRIRILRPEIPVLLSTGRADLPSVQLLASQSGVTLLPKPYSSADLQRSLESVQAG